MKHGGRTFLTSAIPINLTVTFSIWDCGSCIMSEVVSKCLHCKEPIYTGQPAFIMNLRSPVIRLSQGLGKRLAYLHTYCYPEWDSKIKAELEKGLWWTDVKEEDKKKAISRGITATREANVNPTEETTSTSTGTSPTYRSTFTGRTTYCSRTSCRMRSPRYSTSISSRPTGSWLQSNGGSHATDPLFDLSTWSACQQRCGHREDHGGVWESVFTGRTYTSIHVSPGLTGLTAPS